MVKVNFVHARTVVGKGLDGDRGILGLARQFLDASLGCWSCRRAGSTPSQPSPDRSILLCSDRAEVLIAYIHVDALAQMLVARRLVARCKSLSIIVRQRGDDYHADFSAIGLCLTHVAPLSNA